MFSKIASEHDYCSGLNLCDSYVFRIDLLQWSRDAVATGSQEAKVFSLLKSNKSRILRSADLSRAVYHRLNKLCALDVSPVRKPWFQTILLELRGDICGRNPFVGRGATASTHSIAGKKPFVGTNPLGFNRPIRGILSPCCAARDGKDNR